jgi:hypothetical protein
MAVIAAIDIFEAMLLLGRAVALGVVSKPVDFCVSRGWMTSRHFNRSYKSAYDKHFEGLNVPSCGYRVILRKYGAVVLNYGTRSNPTIFCQPWFPR